MSFGFHRIDRFVTSGVLMEVVYASLYLVPPGPSEVLWLIIVNAVNYLILGYLVWQIWSVQKRGDEQHLSIWILVVFGLVFRLTLVPHPVVGSDDIYRYLWDGKVAASGHNPYAYLPADERLAYLATPDLPAKVNHPELRTLYPPLAEALFLASHTLFGDSAGGVKLLLVVLDALTIAVLAGVLRDRKMSFTPLILYAWSPLPVLYFGLDGHIDALGIPFFILCIGSFAAGRQLRGSLALGLSMLAKLVPALVIPLALRSLRGVRRLLVPAVPVLMLLAGYAFTYDPGWGVLESMKTFGSRWEFNGSFFSVIFFLSGSNETAHFVSGGVGILCLGILSFLNRPFIEKIFWGFVIFMLLSPVVHPWYLTWLAALLVLRWSTAVFVFLGLSAVANVVVYQYRAFGRWEDQPGLLLIEYLPVAVLLVSEALRGDVLRKTEARAPLATADPEST